MCEKACKKIIVNIDSRFRNKSSSYISENETVLPKNSLSFNKGSNIIKLYHKNHPFIENDYCLISNVKLKKTILHTYDYNNEPVLEFFDQYMKINYAHGIVNEDNEYYINISGIKGNYIGNISTDVINGNHKIYFTVENIKSSPAYFFIKLNMIMTEEYKLNSHNFAIEYLYINDIPLDCINNFHQILCINKDEYSICLSKSSSRTWNLDRKINVSKISSMQTGYKESNNYKINIGQNITNIMCAKIISSEFPFVNNKIIHNNKLYWNLAGDNKLYHLNIPYGNYTKNGIVKYIQNNSNFDIQVDEYNNIVIFKLLRYVDLYHPFKKVHIMNDKYYLDIYHKNHGLKTNDYITITDAQDFDKIPSKYINGYHQIYQIVDNHYYSIEINGSFDFIKKNNNNNNNNTNATLIIPQLFRLRFDYEDSINILGFRNIGHKNSLFNFNYSISNTDPYIGEQYGYNIPIELHDPYFIIKIKLLNGIKNTGINDNIFNKIQINSKCNKYIYNGHIDTVIYYDNLIDISHLDIEIFTIDGKPYNFMGLDHSFCIEFTSKY